MEKPSFFSVTEADESTAGTGQFHQESSVEDAALPQILTAAQDSAFRIMYVLQML
jgi:hypothetical protein